MKMIALAPPLPPTTAAFETPPGAPDLRTVAGVVVRDLIRRDPALWARVRADASLWRQFGFDEDDTTAG